MTNYVIKNKQSNGSFKFTQIGEQLTGIFKGTTMVEVNGDDTRAYLVQTDDGATRSLLASAALDEGFDGVPEGTGVQLTYKGQKLTSKGRKYNIIEVGVAEAS